MTESNPGNQKLTIVHASEGGYLVGSYYKVADRLVADLPTVIDFMFGLAPIVLQAEPTYVDLSEPDQAIIEAIRSHLVRRDQYWMEVATKMPDNSQGSSRTPRRRAS